jgi:hypothetical protein
VAELVRGPPPPSKACGSEGGAAQEGGAFEPESEEPETLIIASCSTKLLDETDHVRVCHWQ